MPILTILLKVGHFGPSTLHLSPNRPRKYECCGNTNANTKFMRTKKIKASEELHTTNFFKVDSNDVLAMLLHMTNSCKWVPTAPTLPYGKDRENESR